MFSFSLFFFRSFFSLACDVCIFERNNANTIFEREKRNEEGTQRNPIHKGTKESCLSLFCFSILRDTVYVFVCFFVCACVPLSTCLPLVCLFSSCCFSFLMRSLSYVVDFGFGDTLWLKSDCSLSQLFYNIVVKSIIKLVFFSCFFLCLSSLVCLFKVKYMYVYVLSGKKSAGLAFLFWVKMKSTSRGVLCIQEIRQKE